MQEQDEILLDLYNEETVQMPIHSRLYHLKPMGVGTPFVESLTSYVARLAEVHSVSPRTLISQEIVPHLEQSYLSSSLHQNHSTNSRALKSFWRSSITINGMHKWAEDWVRALELLTLRTELRFLTILSWREVLSPFQLMQRTHYWCPVCYEDWREAGLIIYQPLLWTLKDICWCPKHFISLQQQCPYADCKRKLHALMPRLSVGYCSWCNRWLGVSLQDYEAKNMLLQKEEIQRHQSIGHVVEEMLSITSSLQILPCPNTIAEIITVYVANIASGGINKIARQLKIQIGTVMDWQKGKRLPQLHNFLQLCSLLQISPAALLVGKATTIVNSGNQISLDLPKPEPYKRRKTKIDVERDRNALEEALRAPEDSPPSLLEVTKNLGYTHTTSVVRRFPELCRAVSARYSSFQKKKREAYLQIIEKSLEVVLTSTEGPPPSLYQVAKNLGYKYRYLYKYFPELCQAISARYLEGQREKSIERIEQICEEVRQAVQYFHIRGIYPSNRKVRGMLTSSALMKEAKVYATWKEALKELGWQ